MTALWRVWARVFPEPIPVEVLIADPKRRSVLTRQLRAGILRLRHVYGGNLPESLAVIARHSETGGASYSEFGEGDGRLTVIRLALVADGRELSVDEVLAALCEQVHAIASRGVAAPAIIRRRIQDPLTAGAVRPDAVNESAGTAGAAPVPTGSPVIRVLDDADTDPLAKAG